MSKFFKRSKRWLKVEENVAKILFIALITVVVSGTAYYNYAIAEQNVGYGYGYDAGSYGYGYTYSSDVPNTPGSFACTVGSSTSVNCSWTQATLSADGRILDNFTSYKLYWALTSGNANRTSGSSTLGATGTAQTTVSITVSGLSAGTIYYLTAYTLDDNDNYSAAATVVSLTTAGSGGGDSGNGGGGGGSLPATTTTTETTTTETTTEETVAPGVVNPAEVATLVANLGVSRDIESEAANSKLADSDLQEFGVLATAEQKTSMVNFITYGISTATQNLGSGERRAVLRDYLETVGRSDVIWSDIERMTNGQKPVHRNLAKEQARVGEVLNKFIALVGHRPNFQNPAEDLAWNTMMYRIRFSRDLNKERAGIGVFRNLFGRIPTSPLDWSVVRASGYAL